MPVPTHRRRETFSHLIGSYGYIYMEGKPTLYKYVRLVAYGQVPLTLGGPMYCPSDPSDRIDDVENLPSYNYVDYDGDLNELYEDIIGVTFREKHCGQ